MRQPRSLVALPLLAAGCLSNSNGNPPGADAGQIPLEDSGQPALDGTIPGDSSVRDSSVDTSAPPEDSAPPADAADAGPALVTIVVTNDVGPEPGVLLLFHDPTGAVTGNATTGANGAVVQDLAASSQVTAVLQGPNGMAFVTIQGVQPGDSLTVFDSTNPAFPSSTVTIDALPDAAPPGTTFLNASIGPCPGGGTGAPIEIGGITFPCELQGKYPLLVVAAGQTGEVAYAYANGNALPPDGGGADLTVPGPWRSDESAPTFTLTNMPTALSDAGSPFYEIEYGEISGNVPLTQTQSPQPDSDGGLYATFLGHPSYPDSIQVEGTVRQDLSSVILSANVYETMLAIATRTAADASAGGVIDMSQALPEITSAAINADDAGTSSQPVVTWTSLGSLAATDGLIVVTFFSLAFADGGSVSSVPWTIVLPPSATSATPPALPASVGTPAVIAGQYTVPTVMAVEATYLSGYAQMRQAAATLVPPITEFNVGGQQLRNPGSGPAAPTLPVDGTLRLTAVTSSGD